MQRHLLKSISISIGLGSFMYLLNGVFGTLEVLQTTEIISVWIAAALIGAVPPLYHTKISDDLVIVIQFTVGITAFTAVALFNGWIAINLTEILFYAGVTFVIMLIIYITFYLLSVQNSKKINEKLKGK